VRVPRATAARHSTPLAIGLALTLTLSACLAEDTSSPARSDGRPPVQVDASLGVVRVPVGAAIDVRMVLDGPEDDEMLGAVLEAAFRTAVEDFGVVRQGFRVELGPAIMTTCSREDGARVGAELAELDTLVAVLGPQCTGSLLGLQGPLSAAGMTIVTPRPTELTLTVGADGLPGQDRAEGVWRTAPSALQQARAAAQHAFDELGSERAATLRDDSIESAGLAAAFRAHFQSLGGTVVIDREVDRAILGEDGVQSEQQDADQAAALDALLDAVAAGTVDVAFLALGPDLLLAVADGWSGRSRLAATTRITTSTGGVSVFLGDEASQGHLLTSPVLAFGDVTSAVTGMSSSQTLERVRSLSGAPDPAGWWAYAYDAATLLLKALEDTSIIDSDGSLVISRAELRENLARTSFTGLTGALACAALGDCAAPRIVIHAHDDASVSELAAVPIVARIDDLPLP